MRIPPARAAALLLVAASCGPAPARAGARDGKAAGRGEPSAVSIPAIQGRGHRSPHAGEVVRTEGVVTLVARNGRTFWLQDPRGDGDPSTSDGIRVSLGSRGEPAPAAGDRIEITGRVEEKKDRGRAGLSVTQLERPSGITILSRGEPLPDPALLEDLPDTELPRATTLWESLEGMRVRVGAGVVVAPSTAHGEFAMLAAADAVEGSGYRKEDSVILVRPLGPGQVDNNPERILVAGAAISIPPVRPGDPVREVVGVVDFAYGEYRILAERAGVTPRKLPEAPVSRRTSSDGDLTVTTFNVENLFDTEDDPATRDERTTPTVRELETKLKKLALAMRLELRLPEIVVVEEVENEAILQRVADLVNDAAGTAYVATSRGSSDARGIEVAFLWDSERVKLREARLLGGADVAAAFGTAGRSPGREPLEGTFEMGGRTLVILGNHWRSKWGDEPLHVLHPPPRRPSERVRKAQARAVRRRVDEILGTDPKALLLVAGDLNDFPFAEPGEGEDHPAGILEGHAGQAPLADLVGPSRAPGAWTYVYQGNAEILDHILVSPSLLPRVAGLDVLHCNAGWPASLGADPSTPLRCSDHDPVELRLRW